MKRNISLYIAGTKVDLDDNSLILFNYAMTDLTNPTIVKNSYSHQVKLKGTKTNNKLFGEIFRLDRQTIYSDGYTGVNFDPMRKTPFEIYDDTSTCLESGYVKLNAITRNGADISYNVTLYGGLGSFLYGLSYNEDGSKKTLADLWYTDLQGTEFLFKNYDLYMVSSSGHRHVKDAWSYLITGNYQKPIWNIVNFAPCYNGLPKDFDSSRIYMLDTAYSNCLSSITDDKGVEYTSSGGGALYVLQNKHTEWEVGDLRWYLQRPVIRIAAILDAICNEKNNGGYTVNIEKHMLISMAYMTLTMIPTESREKDNFFHDVLQATPYTPADILCSLVKTFGMYILCNSQTKVVDIISRETFFKKYKTAPLDLTRRVDIQSLNIAPMVVDTKYYQMGGEVAGEFAEDYKNEYKVDYAAQRINTGYEFGLETKNLTNDIVFKGAAQVIEKNRLFKTVWVDSTKNAKVFPFPQFENVKVQLYNNKNEMKEFPLELVRGYDEYFSDSRYSDSFPKMQFHSSNNEQISGDGVLLFMQEITPVDKQFLFLTFDLVQSYGEGENPCWVMGYGERVIQLPLFRRFGNFPYTLDWAASKAYGMPIDNVQNLENRSLYAQFWKGYIQDLYNGNTKILKCKVNLRGMENGQELLRRFYWFQDSLWVMSKISNLSLTTYDDAECELIKVNDIENYTNQAGW